MTASQRKYFRLRKRALRAALAAQHVCDTCRRGPQPEHRKTCVDCIDAKVAKKRERRAAMAAQKRDTTVTINETGRSADRHISGPWLPATEYRECLQAYSQGIDGGVGYAVGNETDGINDVDGIGVLIHRAGTDRGIAVYRDNAGYRIAVGDVNGPFAVDIDADDEPDLYD